MTRIDIDITRLVLRDVPPEFAEGIGPLIAERLAELATADRRGEELPRWAGAPRRARAVADREGLAALVARDAWTSAAAGIREGGTR